MTLKIGDKVTINGQENIIENIVEDMVYLSHDFPIEMKHLERFQIAEKNHSELARTTWWREDMKQNDKDSRIGERVLDKNGGDPATIVGKENNYYILEFGGDREQIYIEENDLQNYIDDYNKYNKIEKKGSGQRKDSGKIVLDECPIGIIASVAAVFMLNSKQYGGKYNKKNWTLGMPWSKVINPLKRHLAKWEAGEEIDEESGLHHLAHIAANVAILIEYTKTYQIGDDRNKSEQVTIKDIQKQIDIILKKRKNEN